MGRYLSLAKMLDPEQSISARARSYKPQIPSFNRAPAPNSGPMASKQASVISLITDSVAS